MAGGRGAGHGDSIKRCTASAWSRHSPAGLFACSAWWLLSLLLPLSAQVHGCACVRLCGCAGAGAGAGAGADAGVGAGAELDEFLVVQGSRNYTCVDSRSGDALYAEGARGDQAGGGVRPDGSEVLWAGLVVCALTQSICSDLQEQHGIRLDPSLMRQASSCACALPVPPALRTVLVCR